MRIETVLEGLYEGVCVFIFCTALALLFYSFSTMNTQADLVKKNIYEQHMLYGAGI